MNRDVDLTENGQFTDVWKLPRAFNFLSDGNQYPWEFSYTPKYGDEKPLVLTGNYEDIQFQKMMLALESGKICERCGRSLVPFLLESHATLCPYCEKEMDEYLRHADSHWLICDDRSMPITQQMIASDIVLAMAQHSEDAV